MSQLIRKGSVVAGSVGELSLASNVLFGFGPNGRLLTAVKTAGGDLKLIDWFVKNDGSEITRGKDASGGPADQIAAGFSHEQLVVVMRDSAGHLRLKSWTSDLVLQDNAVAGSARGFALLCFLPKNGVFSVVVTAMCDDAGNLKLIAWQLGADGSLTRGGDASLGPVLEITIAESNFSPLRAVVAARTAAGDLQLSEWHISDDASQISLLGQASAGAVSHLSSATYGSALVTSFRNGSGNLELIAWEVAAGTFTRGGTAVAGGVSAVASAFSSFAAKDLVLTVAVRDSQGNLELIDWHLSGSGPQVFTRGAKAQAGAIGQVGLVLAWNQGTPNQNIVVTAVKNASADLELIAWQRA